MRFVLLVFASCLFGTAAAAETVTVRSGEHDGFTRLVLQLPAEAAWSLERSPSGYLLRTEGADITYDISKAFDYIGRDRIRNLTADVARGLLIDLTCACHAITSEAPAGLLVIDIRDGSEGDRPATPDSKPEGTRPDINDFWLQRLQPIERPSEAETVLPTEMPETGTDPDRLDAAARLLEWQISRAMGQGLVEPVDKTPAIQLVEPGLDDGDRSTDPSANELGVAAETAHSKVSPDPRKPQIPVQVCTASEDFVIRNWAEDRDFSQQLADAKGALLGEFDALDNESLLKTARLYLHFGLGAEAADLLRNFGPGLAEDHHLSAIAEVIDGRVGPDNPLLSLQCEGDALLWRALANPGTLTSGNTPTVLGTFSALPLPLRQLLGPRLVDLFLTRADLEAARTVRDAVMRGSENVGSVALIDLSIGLADPKARPDPVALVSQLAEQRENLPQSLVLVIDAYKRRDIAVPAQISDLTETLAFEYRDRIWGKDLRNALAAALASQGRFREAFTQMDALAGKEDSTVPTELFGSLTEGADDGQFLQLIFERMAEARTAEHVLHWNAIGSRLLELGFPREASGFLHRPLQTEADHILAARIAVAEGRNDDALSALRGLASEEAVHLRRSLMPGLGQQIPPVGATSMGPDDRPGSASGSQGSTDQQGLLSASRTVLEQSNADREKLEGLVKGSMKP